MNARERVQLWNWINEYVVTCGGDPSDTRYARKRREEAVVRVEGAVQEIVERLYREGFPPIPVEVRHDEADSTFLHIKTELPVRMVTICERCLIDLPENPTPPYNPDALADFRKAIMGWMERGNMRHENKPDPRLPTLASQSQALAEQAEVFRELLVWAENWLPDEAKDQGAREVLHRCKAVLNPPADDSRD